MKLSDDGRKFLLIFSTSMNMPWSTGDVLGLGKIGSLKSDKVNGKLNRLLSNLIYIRGIFRVVKRITLTSA